MIDAGSNVAARSSGQLGTVVSREFDAWARDWFYEVDWADGSHTRSPFLSLVEVTCASRNGHVKME